MDVVIPGTVARAADPIGRALRRAGRDDTGSPAPVAAAGISFAAKLDWTLDTEDEKLAYLFTSNEK